MGSFGETLRQARLDKGVTLSEAERETRIRRRHLESLENEDTSSLPAPVYVRGMIRSYARYLGLAPESMVDLFYSARPREERVSIRSSAPEMHEHRRLPLRTLAVAAGAVAAVLLLVVAWSQYSVLAESLNRVDERQARRTLTPTGLSGVAAVPTATPGPTSTPQPAALPTRPPPTATPAPTPVQGVLIEARLVAPTWMEVWVDEDRILAENLPAGATRSFKADRAVRLRAADGAAVEVTENGVPRGILDPGGRPVEGRWTRA